MEASVVLLTLNGERYLDESLQMIRQQTLAPVQIVAIDSGSADRTIDILKKHDVEIHPIDATAFSHSATRNLAARLCRGRFVVFLTQDATPADSSWLAALIDGFRVDASRQIVAVYSRQAPRADADLLERHDLSRGFGQVREVRSYPERAEQFRHRIWSFIHFSNASAAYERECLIANPFNESLAMGEDQEWAKRALESGRAIVYEPSSVVWHSHRLGLRETSRRHYEMGAAFSRFLSPELGRRGLPLFKCLYHLLLDTRFVAGAQASPRQKLGALLRAPLHRAVAHYSYYKGWNAVGGRAIR